MFMIFPSVLISSRIIYDFLNNTKLDRKNIYYSLLIFFIFLIGIFSLNHSVLPLNPKEAYVESIKSFNLNFLIPFSGGSGPIGFYQSALVAGSIVSVAAAGIILDMPDDAQYKPRLSMQEAKLVFVSDGGNTQQQNAMPQQQRPQQQQQQQQPQRQQQQPQYQPQQYDQGQAVQSQAPVNANYDPMDDVPY